MPLVADVTIAPAMGHYTIYTAGHGGRDWQSFAAQLHPYNVEVIVDVRTFPYVHGAPDFNRDRLEHLARNEGWEYIWLGHPLGALTADGRVDYVSREREPLYHNGIQELLGLAHERTVCLLGGQADPALSHRHLLIAQTLLRCNVEVRHIMPSGNTMQAQADLFHAKQA